MIGMRMLQPRELFAAQGFLASEHAQHHKQRHPREKVCAVCGATFAPHPTKRARAVTCSKACGVKRAAASRSKLTAEDVAAIRALLADGAKGIDVAAQFAVTPGRISQIRHCPPVAAALVRANVGARA